MSSRKRPFPTPQAAWLRDLGLKAIESVLSSKPLLTSGLCDPKAVTQVYKEFCGGNEGLHPIIWRLLNLEAWLRCFSL